MKVAVLTYSHAGDALLQKRVERSGFAAINIGEYMQTLAVRNAYRRSGIAEDRIITLDRDSLPSYAGEPVVVVMNAVFDERSFPIPDVVVPVFIGFQARDPVIEANADYLRRHAPIGCRDIATVAFCRKHDIEAFLTGCLTLAMPDRPIGVEPDRVFLVHGEGGGRFPAEALRHVPEALLRDVEFVSHTKIVQRLPLTAEDMAEAEAYAASLLKLYRLSARLVITSLHSAVSPCIASNIPVVVCRVRNDQRFGYLSKLLPVHVRPDFKGIDWDPLPVDLARVRTRLLARTRTALRAAKAL